jgi:hypothetical protein
MMCFALFISLFIFWEGEMATTNQHDGVVVASS